MILKRERGGEDARLCQVGARQLGQADSEAVEAKQGVGQSTEAIRETTKWIFATGSVFVAAAFAALPFSSLKALDPTSPRFYIVLTATALGLGATAAGMAAAARVFVHGYPTLRRILDEVDLSTTSDPDVQYVRAQLRSEHDYLYGPVASDLNELWQRIRDRNREGRSSAQAIDASTAAELAEAETRVIGFVDQLITERRFERLLDQIKWLLPIVALCAVIVAQVGREQPADKLETRITPVSLAVLDTELRERIHDDAGCDDPSYDKALLVGSYADTDEVQLSIPATATCHAISIRTSVTKIAIKER